MHAVYIIALMIALLGLSDLQAQDFCEKCDYAICHTNKDAFNKCKHCYGLPDDVFENCRKGAEDAGFLKGAFKASDALAEAKDYTVKDVSKKMDDLKQLIWSIQKNIALLTPSPTKDKLQKNGLTTLEFWQRYRDEIGMNTLGAKANPNTPVKWAHERYTPILGSAVLLNGEVAAAILSQAKALVKKKSGLFGKLFNRSKLKLMNTKLAALEQYIPLIKGDQDVSNQIKYAQSLNKTYGELVTVLGDSRRR